MDSAASSVLASSDDNVDIDGRRILVIDDSSFIHEDFRKILGPGSADELFEQLKSLSIDLFGGAGPDQLERGYHVDTASQGEEGAELVRRSVEQDKPYSLAFVDMRMPPGWDGVRTIEELWKVDPKIQAVVCTAYSDFSWSEVQQSLRESNQLHLLRKPFQPEQVRKFAALLCSRWIRERSSSR